MSLDYEKKKYKVLKEMVDNYWQELQQDRLRALDMPIETDNGFNVEREALIDDIDEKLEILRRHAKEPYFAKLVFNDVNDGKEFKGYIGRLSIGDIANPEDEKVVDWRSPISDLYYNGRLGRSDYTAHGNKFEVDLHLKRQINIKNDEVESIYDFEEAVSSDEFLQPFLTQSADNRLKNIVATIQEEQNRIIRLPVFKNCIIQGVAGSGKTTVALHRLSYLIYNFKKSIYPEEFLILSPNEIFTSYISTTLVDLDADKANSFSINKMVENVIGTEYKVLNKHEQFRKLEQKNISYKYLKYKTSLKFKDVIEKFIEDYTKSIFGSDLVIKGVKVLDAQDVYKYYKLDRKEPLEVIAEHGGKKLSLALHYDEIIKKKAYQNIDNADVDMFKKWEIKRLVESNKYKYFKTITTKSINIFKLYKAFIESLDKYSDYEELNILKKYTLDNLKNNPKFCFGFLIESIIGFICALSISTSVESACSK